MEHSHIKPLTQVYRETINKWGEEAQYDQMIEECAELIVAIKHFKRGKTNRQTVIDELADITLMLGQLTWMFGAENIDTAVQNKLNKLQRLLDLPNDKL